MKLKRFLLRYEPPGVGLEVEAEPGRGTEVVHKDLPPQGEVDSSRAIRDLVDQLIASEPEMLTKRRHSEALAQLLSRLYQVELEPLEDPPEKEKPSPSKEEEAPASSPVATAELPPVQEGQQVVIVGLKGQQQVHNGEVGTVAKARVEKGKFEVLFPGLDGAVVKIRGPEHIIPVSPSTKASLAVGATVAIRGLRNHIELNGCLGRIVECHEESHRFEVRAINNEQLFRVKQENLVPVDAAYVPLAAAAQKENREPNAVTSTPRGLRRDAGDAGASSAASIGGGGGGPGDSMESAFETGTVVELVGLKSAMQYNGQKAEVLSVDRGRGRYEIRLGDGSVKTIRAENVVLHGRTGTASKRSPREKHKKDGPGSSNGKSKP